MFQPLGWILVLVGISPGCDFSKPSPTLRAVSTKAAQYHGVLHGYAFLCDTSFIGKATPEGRARCNAWLEEGRPRFPRTLQETPSLWAWHEAVKAFKAPLAGVMD